MLIQIHMLQNYAPSNLNRDDSGAPKDAVFGNVQRGRISSQAIKRSIRRSPIFVEAFEQRGLLARRTNRLPDQINKALEALGADEEARRAIVGRIPEIGKREGAGTGNGTKNEDDSVLKTSMLVFLNPREVEMVAARLWELYREKGAAGFAKLKIGEIEAAMKHETPRSVDIAMFGRMTTSTAFEDVQAAVQVAHAISTNTVAPQFDYFTAVDDISGESGAGMIGTVEFNSNTYYKYFCVHWEKLVENLGGDAEIALDAVTALIEAAALTHPSGKQNSFAAHNPPDFVLVEVSPRNIPLSYANAFVRPAAPTPQETLVEASARMLVEYADQVRPAYGLEAEQACLSLAGPAPRAARVTPTLQKLQEWVREQVGRGQDG